MTSTSTEVHGHGGPVQRRADPDRSAPSPRRGSPSTADDVVVDSFPVARGHRRPASEPPELFAVVFILDVASGLVSRPAHDDDRRPRHFRAQCAGSPRSTSSSRATSGSRRNRWPSREGDQPAPGDGRHPAGRGSHRVRMADRVRADGQCARALRRRPRAGRGPCTRRRWPRRCVAWPHRKASRATRRPVARRRPRTRTSTRTDGTSHTRTGGSPPSPAGPWRGRPSHCRGAKKPRTFCLSGVEAYCSSPTRSTTTCSR